LWRTLAVRPAAPRKRAKDLMSLLLPILMRRLFPVMAVAAIFLLMRYLVAEGELYGSQWSSAVVFMCFVNTITDIYNGAASRRIGELVIREWMPDWPRAQAEKNFRKGNLYVVLSLAIFFLVDGLHHKGGVAGAWFIGLMAFDLAFQIGAFVGEFVIMSSQAKLLRSLEESAKPADALGFY
jgi:hypothetical protein